MAATGIVRKLHTTDTCPNPLLSPMSLCTIKRLFPGDEERLKAIRLRALAEDPAAFITTFAEATALPLEEWQRQLERLATFVAVMGGRDVGVARSARHDDSSDSAYLMSMWVAPEARRRGVAEALVDSIVDWARGQGFRRLLLDVVENNPSAAALYLKKGFVANGIVGALPPPREHLREFQHEMKLS